MTTKGTGGGKHPLDEMGPALIIVFLGFVLVASVLNALKDSL